MPGLLGKAWRNKQAFDRHLWHSVVPQTNSQDSPKASPRVIFNWKNFIEPLKLIAQMNADWKVDKAQYAEFNVPTCGKIAVWQLCRERQPLWNRHDSWWPELKMFGSMPLVFVPMAQGSSRGWRKRIVVRQSEFDRWVCTSLHPCSKPTWFMQVCLGKPSCEIMQR